MDYVKLIYRPLAVSAARHAIVGRNRTSASADRGRFKRGDIDLLLKNAWLFYDKDAKDLPAEPTIGSRMNMRLACFTMAFLDALRAIGTERQYAIELVSDAVWRVYRLWSVIASALTRFTPGKRTALAFAVGGRQGAGVSLTFPFNAPGSASRRRGGKGNRLQRRPVSGRRHFPQAGRRRLCTSSWCNLDYPLAEWTGEKLVRTKTLVKGDGCCDFRLFPARPAGPSPCD